MKNLKQRLGMAALLLSFGMYVSAQEFIMNGVKYIDNGDRTATIKEYRKLDGGGNIYFEDFLRKDNNIYFPTGIASDACKGINVTSLRLPSGLKTISSHAFESISLDNLMIPGSVEKIEDNAFGDNAKVNILDIWSSNIWSSKDVKPLLLRGTEFNFSVKYLRLDRSIDTLSISPFKNSSTLERVEIGQNLKFLPADFFEGCSALTQINIETSIASITTDPGIYSRRTSAELESLIQTVSCIRNAISSLAGDIKVSVSGYQRRLMNLSDYLAKIEDDLAEMEELRDKKREEENEVRLKFINQCAELIRIAEEEPEAHAHFRFEGLIYKDKHYDSDDLLEAYPDVWITALNFACDSIFLTKEELTDIDKTIGKRECNDQIQIMLFDTLHQVVSKPLEQWAYYNMLNNDPYKEQHKKNYERILEVSEKLIKSDSSDKNYDPCYEMLTQLVGLCGLDKWKEAEQYFPKVHRAITKNGKYDVPKPLTYIQTCLTERGYKAATPVYAKTTTAQEPTNAQMVEFFINRGIEIYKDKKEEKKREETYRQLLLEEARKQAQKR